MFWNRTGKSEQSEQAAQIAKLGAFEQAIQSRVPYIEFTPEGWSPSSTIVCSPSWVMPGGGDRQAPQRPLLSRGRGNPRI